jgi:hypothetical protein
VQGNNCSIFAAKSTAQALEHQWSIVDAELPTSATLAWKKSAVSTTRLPAIVQRKRLRLSIFQVTTCVHFPVAVDVILNLTCNCLLLLSQRCSNESIVLSDNIRVILFVSLSFSLSLWLAAYFQSVRSASLVLNCIIMEIRCLL